MGVALGSRKFWAGIGLMSASVLATPVGAVPVSLDAGVSLGLSYEDNPGLSTTQTNRETSAVNTAADMSVSRIAPASTLALRGHLQAAQYQKQQGSEFNNDLRILTLQSAVNSLRAKLSFDAELRRDTTLITYLDPEAASPDAVALDINPGVTVSKRVERNRNTYTPTFFYRLTESSQVRLQYRYQNMIYDKVSGAPLRDYEDQGVFLAWSTAVGERGRFDIGVDQGRFIPEKGADAYRHGGKLNYLFETSASGKLAASFAYHEYYRQDHGTTSANSRKASYGINYQSNAPVTRWTIDLRRDVQPSSAGELLTVDQLGLDLARKLSELTAVRARVRAWNERKLVADSTYQDVSQGYSELSVNTALTRKLKLSGSYRYRWREFVNDNATAENNGIFLDLVYNAQRAFF